MEVPERVNEVVRDPGEELVEEAGDVGRLGRGGTGVGGHFGGRCASSCWIYSL